MINIVVFRFLSFSSSHTVHDHSFIINGIILRYNSDINDHMEAMYFSLSTMTTIGYGVSGKS